MAPNFELDPSSLWQHLKQKSLSLSQRDSIQERDENSSIHSAVTVPLRKVTQRPFFDSWMSEVEQTLRRIEGNKSVLATIVLDGGNHVIHQNYRSTEPGRFAEKLPPLIDRARSIVRDLDPTNDLTFLRIRAGQTEILVAPGDDYTLIVVQDVVLIES
jgi:dynein light chain roadblock-type